MCKEPELLVEVSGPLLRRMALGWLTPENLRLLWNRLIDFNDGTQEALARDMGVPYRKFWVNTENDLLELVSEMMESCPGDAPETFVDLLRRNSFLNYRYDDSHFFVMSVPREGLPDELMAFGEGDEIYGNILEIVLRSYAGRPSDEVSEILRRGDE